MDSAKLTGKATRVLERGFEIARDLPKATKTRVQRSGRRVGLFVLLASTGHCGDAVSSEDFEVPVLVGQGAFDTGQADPDLGIGDTTSLDAALLDLGPEDAGSADLGSLDVGVLDAGDPCAADVQLTLGPFEAGRRAGDLAGTIVRVTTTASVGPEACTERACAGTDICCNVCTAPLRAGPLLLTRTPCIRTATLGCSRSVCEAIPICNIPRVEADYEGVLQSSPPRLEVLRVRF